MYHKGQSKTTSFHAVYQCSVPSMLDMFADDATMAFTDTSVENITVNLNSDLYEEIIHEL